MNVLLAENYRVPVQNDGMSLLQLPMPFQPHFRPEFPAHNMRGGYPPFDDLPAMQVACF